MRTIGRYNRQDDEFVHPLWLGILLLFSVMIIIGTICCLKIKCGSQLRHLLNILCGRNNEMNDTSLPDDKYSTIRYSYNWQPIYSSQKSPSPKLYTLVKHIQTANLQKQLFIRQQSIHEDENEIEIKSTAEFDQLPQISIPPSTDGMTNPEIARKFYASMRKTSQCQNSSSLDSYNDETLLASNTPSPNIDPPITPNQETNIKLFRAPRFFKSIPNEESLVITL